MLNMTRESREFLDRVAAGAPALPECRSCGITFLPPRALCPACGDSDAGWVEAPQARGTVYSLTRMADGKTIVLVDLDAVTGPGRLLAEAVETEAAAVQIGDRVTMEVLERENPTGDRTLVARVGEAS